MTTPAILSVYRPLLEAKARLVCFPHAGGAASAFRGLKAALAPAGIEVCALQPAGRENRMKENPAATAQAMADEVAAALTTLPRLPTCYLGHSMGGLIAYLTARQITPDHLIASASTSPSACRMPRSTHLLPPDEFRHEVTSMGGIPDLIRETPSLFDLFEATLRADYRVFDTYIHSDSAPLTCPLTVYHGTRDSVVTIDGLRKWQDLTTHPVKRRVFPGNHFFLYQEAAKVAEALKEDIITSNLGTLPRQNGHPNTAVSEYTQHPIHDSRDAGQSESYSDVD